MILYKKYNISLHNSQSNIMEVKIFMSENKCTLCPRMCSVNRKTNTGYCLSPDTMRLARAALHMWEEPVISGKNGSGTIFFSGCTLRCCFCQNHKISAENFGTEVSEEKFADIIFDLQSKGAHNINLVTPTHYADKIASVISKLKPKLNIPVLYNTSGYENISTIDMLEGCIDIYLPDLKYFSPELSKRYSSAENYFEKASAAIKRMYEQVGEVKFGEDGLLKKGLVIRHMVLPGAYKDSIKLLDWINDNFDKEKILISLMCQYTPMHKSAAFEEINRRVTTYEYKKVTDHAAELGLCGFVQQKDAASIKYVPKFDLEGVR